MKQEKETIQTLINFCTSNNRLCPKYEVWQKVYSLLRETKFLSGHGGKREPADPYIIYQNWEHLMPIELQFQFKSYLEWAEDHDQLDEIGTYLRSLHEDMWVHYGEI